MGLMTTLLVGMGVAQAATQVMDGMAAKTEADYNASIALSESRYNAAILHQKAGMIEDQKKLQAAQDNRAIRMVMGRTTAVTAAKGIQLSGSPMAIMIDTRTQLEMDKLIGQYNLDVQKYGVISQAESVTRAGQTRAASYRRAGKTARTAGYVGALSTLYQTAAYTSFDTGKTAKKGKGA